MARIAAILGFAAVDAVATGKIPAVPERLALVVRSVVLPGLGFVTEAFAPGIVMLITAGIAFGVWMRWGLWLPVALVWTLGAVLTLHYYIPDARPSSVGASMGPHVALASHEITGLIVFYLFMSWISAQLRRLPLLGRLLRAKKRSRPEGDAALFALGAVDLARAVALWGIARESGATGTSAELLRQALDSSRLRRRARVMALLAPGFRSRHPLYWANAHLRAAWILSGRDSSGAVFEAASRESAAAPLGMVATEPGWVSLLDSTLLAAVLHLRGDPAVGIRWKFVLSRWFRLHRSHRPAARHSFLGLTRMPVPLWEHAAATAIAGSLGWVDAEAEWPALRRPTLAAVGRGGRMQEDNRMVAAGRCWTALIDDPKVKVLLRRVSIAASDPVARALDALAETLANNQV